MRPALIDRRMRALRALSEEDERMRQTLANITFGPQVRIRWSAIRLRRPLTADTISDRRPPRAADGPPLRRLMRSRGVTLQLELLLLAWAQRPETPKPHRILPLSDPGAVVDLVELVATPAVPATRGAQSAQAPDKRERSVREALRVLAEEGLVLLADGRAPFSESLVLRNETDDQRGRARPRQYSVPSDTAQVVSLPSAFFTNGWHYCLDDSELLAYLMVRDVCGRGGDSHVTADERLRRYAVNKDMLLRTRLLEYAGIIDVRRDPRQERNGTVSNYGEPDTRPDLQRWTLVDEGLDQPAHVALTDAVARLRAER